MTDLEKGIGSLSSTCTSPESTSSPSFSTGGVVCLKCACLSDIAVYIYICVRKKEYIASDVNE